MPGIERRHKLSSLRASRADYSITVHTWDIQHELALMKFDEGFRSQNRHESLRLGGGVTTTLTT
jgi:hypothetical protein